MLLPNSRGERVLGTSSAANVAFEEFDANRFHDYFHEGRRHGEECAERHYPRRASSVEEVLMTRWLGSNSTVCGGLVFVPLAACILLLFSGVVFGGVVLGRVLAKSVVQIQPGDIRSSDSFVVVPGAFWSSPEAMGPLVAVSIDARMSTHLLNPSSFGQWFAPAGVSLWLFAIGQSASCLMVYGPSKTVPTFASLPEKHRISDSLVHYDEKVRVSQWPLLTTWSIGVLGDMYLDTRKPEEKKLLALLQEDCRKHGFVSFAMHVNSYSVENWVNMISMNVTYEAFFSAKCV